MINSFKDSKSTLSLAGLATLSIAAVTSIKLLFENSPLGPTAAGLASLAAVGLLIFTESLFNITNKRWVWLAVTLTVTGYIVFEWPGPANHTYVFVYISLAFALASGSDSSEQEMILENNARNIFLVVMLFAVLQKAITPGYLDGTINAFWMSVGGYGQLLDSVSDRWHSAVVHNDIMMDKYYNETTMRVDAISLVKPIDNLRFWGVLLAFFVLSVELVVALIFVFSKSNLLKHTAVILFVISVFVFRQETGFLSLLCVIGLCGTQPKDVMFRGGYISLVAFFLAMMIIDVGYI